MRVLVVDESPERADLLREGLRQAGHEVTATLSSPLALLKTIEELQPDVIVIDMESPTRDVLEHLVFVSEHTPRPVVMFAQDDAPETIRAATRAGVSAYVVDGLDRSRINSIVEAAVARFDEYQALRTQLAAANLKLSERKVVERAKGLLMKRRGLWCVKEDGHGSQAQARRGRAEGHRRGGPSRCMTHAVSALYF